MVVDDDQDILDVVGQILKMDGYNVYCTSDPRELLSIAEPLPDLLILDIRLGEADGRHLCRLLKANDITRNLPVILFSASTDIKESADQAGADDFIAKPFNIEDLTTKVQRKLNYWTNRF